MDYKTAYDLSLTDPDKYWDLFAKDVIWNKPYSKVLQDKESIFPKWFVGGEINMCYNCLDRQVEEGFGDEIVVIYDSPWRKIVEKITYKQLLESVKLLSGVLVDRCEVKKGDRVLFYMPMIPQCLIGMLACARIGAPYTVINSGFGYKEIAMRINHLEPKVVITTNGGSSSNGFVDFKSKVDLALEFNGFSPDFCIVYNLPEYDKAKINKSTELDWDEQLINAQPKDPVSVESHHPLLINYTSGTTGDPKGLVFDTGAYVVMNKYYMTYMFGVKPGDTMFHMSSFSWFLGQSSMSFGALLGRNPTIIYEGKPCDRNDVLQLLRIIKEYNVVSWTCPPTILRLFMKFTNDDDFIEPIHCLKKIRVGGEPFEDKLNDWSWKKFKCPVIDGWGQTEMGFGITLCLGFLKEDFEISQSTKGVLVPGISGKIVDRYSGLDVPNGTMGRFILKLPLPPLRVSTLFRSDQRFYEIYFQKYPGYYDTMDCAINYGDHIKIISRDDDIIHVEAARVNGTAIQMACLLDNNVTQASVIPLDHAIKGFVPFAFLVPRDYNHFSKEEILQTAINNVIVSVGDVACFDKAVIVPELPINANGKILKKSLELMVNGKPSEIPQTTTNPEVYQDIYNILCKEGYSPCLPK